MLRATLIGELPLLFLAYGSASATLKSFITSPCPREVIVARHNGVLPWLSRTSTAAPALSKSDVTAPIGPEPQSAVGPSRCRREGWEERRLLRVRHTTWCFRHYTRSAAAFGPIDRRRGVLFSWAVFRPYLHCEPCVLWSAGFCVLL
jgi:hypothetical protein